MRSTYESESHCCGAIEKGARLRSANRFAGGLKKKGDRPKNPQLRQLNQLQKENLRLKRLVNDLAAALQDALLAAKRD
jgi:hypothetical protein